VEAADCASCSLATPGLPGRGRPAEDFNLIFREAGEDDLQNDVLCALMALRAEAPTYQKQP
jgi:hypothetical protein